MKSKLIAAVIFLTMFVTVALALVFTQTGVLTITETISVSALNLDVALEPSSISQIDVQVNNSGSNPVDIIALIEVTDSLLGPYPGVTVSPSQPATISPAGNVILSFTVTASNGVPVGTGVVSLNVIRP